MCIRFAVCAVCSFLWISVGLCVSISGCRWVQRLEGYICDQKGSDMMEKRGKAYNPRREVRASFVSVRTLC